MNTILTPDNRRKVLWPIVAVFLGALISINPFYSPYISLPAGIIAWFVDMALVLLLSVRRATVPLGIISTGLFLAVPCFVWASPLARGLLMCVMAVPLAIISASLFAPPAAAFRDRFGFFFSWLGKKKITRRPRRFDLSSLICLVAATVVLSVALHFVTALPENGLWLPARWLSGGIALFAFAEMATASHDFLTALLGLSAPALMRSPVLSTSIAEFWSRRWNVAASELGFNQFCFAPLARHGIIPAMFAAFFASAIVHVLLAFLALGRWKIAFVFGAFFLLQPFLILAERAMHLRRWPIPAARVWTLTALAVTSPLCVEPAFQILTPSLRAADSVLLPTAATLCFVFAANLFFSIGQLAFCVKSPPPTPALEPAATAQ